MSGINELKERSKKHLETNEKRKISLEEMIGNQTVGKPGNQEAGDLEKKQPDHPESRKAINPSIRPKSKPASQPSASPGLQEDGNPNNHSSGQMAIHPSGKFETHVDVKPEVQLVRQSAVFPVKQQQNQKIPTYKMTFNLREDIHKAFNDLYANRILRGCMTEKSEMICEAIQWLIKMEEEQAR